MANNSDQRPYIASRKIYQQVAAIAATASILLGVVVMTAWHLHLTGIIQAIPNSPPIRYNTALAFLLSGIALFSAVYRKRERQRRYLWLTITGGLLVALIGGLSLIQYIVAIDLGIDQLFVQDYISNEVNHQTNHLPDFLQTPIQQFFITIQGPTPGRPSPNASLAFSLMGIALICLGWRQKNQLSSKKISKGLEAISALLAIGAISIGAVALMGYITRLGPAYSWRYLTGVAVPTAIGLIALGSGILALNLSYHRSLPWWLPLGVGFGLCLATTILWQSMFSWTNHLLSQLANLQIASEAASFIIPVANIVFIEGIILSIFAIGILNFDRLSKAQAIQLKMLNQKLAQFNSILNTTLESTADGILVLDTEGRRVHFSKRFIEMWKIPDALAIKMRTENLAIPPDFLLSQVKDPEIFLAATRSMIANLTQESFDVFELKDGRIFERYARPQWLDDRPIGKVLSYRDVTATRQAAAKLRASEELNRSVIASMGEGIALQDVTGAIQLANTRAEEILGLSLEQMQGRTSIDPRWQAIHEDGSPFPGDQHPAMVTLRTGISCRNVVIGVHKPNGDLTWILANSQPLFHSHYSTPYAAVTSFTDITERKQLEDSLFLEKELAQVTLHSIGDAVITTDVNGNIAYFNPMAELLTGWQQSDVHGLPLEGIFRIVNEETRELVANPVKQAIAGNCIIALAENTLLIAKDGSEIAIDDSAAPIRNREGNIVGAVMVFHDVTETRQLSRHISWQANHDALTGLVNRRKFEDHLDQSLLYAKQRNQTHALCYLDLDQFKIVNDTCGHVAGDELLRQVTVLLQGKIRHTDILGRLGGDEFGLLLHQCPNDRAMEIANLLREAIQKFRFVWEDSAFSIGVSIGVVIIDSSSDSLASLLIAADSACYVAKSRGRNCTHLFQENDLDLLQQQGEIRWVARLTQALESDQFHLYAQPIVPAIANSQEAEHYEILLRLHDEAGHLIAPTAFISAAERYNLMYRIDRWVIETLFHRLASARTIDHTMPPEKTKIYSVNLSGSSINDNDFINFVREQFTRYLIPPSMICFEITETLAIRNLKNAREVIEALRSIGCRFSLDDFGSGMSSFTYLKNLPVDYLKIDGSFIKNIVNDPIDYAMVEAITRIAHTMHLKTIAEFVEDAEILDRIRELGIDYVQGYVIARPAPLIWEMLPH